MTRTMDETAGGRGGDGEGLCASATDASTQAGRGDSLAWKRPNDLAVEQKTRLPTSQSAIESSERPTAVAGRGLSEKSRFKRTKENVMPKIELSKLIACAKGLSHAAGDMGQGVRAQLQSGRLTITEGGHTVFRMHVSILGNQLVLDRAWTDASNRQRGLAKLGVLLALRYGLEHGCSTAILGTASELGAFGFWARSGLTHSKGTDVQSAIIRLMQGIHSDQVRGGKPKGEGTSLFEIKNGGSTASTPKPSARRGSY